MARVTPYYGAHGIWKLREPWSTKLGKEYTCTAIRSFIELEIRGMDIYQQVYLPKELEESVYQRDAAEYATLVSILASDGEIIHVPDTYIISYPDISVDDYRRFVISCELGALPADTQISHLTSKVSEAVEPFLGRTPYVNIHIADMTPSGMNPSERVREESNRKAQVKAGKTLSNQLQQMNVRYGELTTYCRSLETKLSELGKDTSNELNDLRSKNTNLNLEISSYRSQINQKDNEISNLTTQIETLNRTINELRNEIRNLGG